MIPFIIFCFIVAVLLAGLMTPILMIRNRKILAQMRAEIEDFGTINPDHREAKRVEYRTRLRNLKAKIYTGDKAALEQARDLLGEI